MQFVKWAYVRDELHKPEKKPRIVPGEELDEKSKKFRKQLQSAATDGADINAVAKSTHEKSLAKLKVIEAAAKAAAKREEERVAELKRIKGEKWLPSIAKQMRLTAQFTGTLKGYNQLLHLVLDEAIKFLRGLMHYGSTKTKQNCSK